MPLRQKRPFVACAIALAIAGSAGAMVGCGGGDPTPAADASADTSGGGSGARFADAPSYSEDLPGFLKYVGDELNQYWEENAGADLKYRPARVMVPTTAANTACGTVDAETSGPAYCGGDMTMVLPVAFFRDRLISADDNGTNDAAVAAAVGHEFGHHLQTLSGEEAQLETLKQQNPDAANLISAANELNADCLMGTWMATVDDEGRLDEGDLGEVYDVLGKIGDDTLSVDAGEAANASTFDHGTTLQRQYWFTVGFDSGDTAKCDGVFDDLQSGALADEMQQAADEANSSITP